MSENAYDARIYFWAMRFGTAQPEVERGLKVTEHAEGAIFRYRPLLLLA